MESIWIDTALLAIPNYAIEEDAAHKLFDRITGLESLLSAEGIRIVLSDNALSDLWENSLGPEFEQINAFLKMMNLDHVFATRDIYKSYQTLFDRAVRASDIPGFEVRKVSDLVCVPALFDELNPIALRSISSCSLASVAAAQQVEEGWSVGSAFPGGGLLYLEFGGTIESVEGPKLDLCGALPLQIKARIRCISGVGDLVSASEAERVWCQVRSLSDAHLAISLRALALRRETDADATFSDLIQFSIGSEFIETLKANQCFGSGRFGATTLDKCAHIVADTGVVEVKVFWRADSKEAPRLRSFDTAVAQRAHITSANEGIRLMFWQIDECVEFANVGVKKEEIILEGQRAKAFTANLDDYL